MRPAIIYYIEERTAPSREGPWSEWGDGMHPGLVFPRALTSVEPLTEEQCKARCVGLGYDGNARREKWRELRCVPYYLEQFVAGAPQQHPDLETPVNWDRGQL